MVLAVYVGVTSFAFVSYDDPQYVTENAHVQQGLTIDTIAWAGSTFHAANWHPLTWISHACDWALFGDNAGMHHLVNVLLHALSAVLLFLLLSHMTQKPWAAAVVAALFAVHPLHVGTVAWVSERKDVLSTCLFLCTILAYRHYANRPTTWRMATVTVVFCLGLMAKPMLVTLPFVLLLLDAWPLRRRSTLLRRVFEKTPLFLASAASCVITVLAQRSGNTVQTLARLPLDERLANSLRSAVGYLRNMICPTDLSFYYPAHDAASSGATIAATLLLTIVTVLAVRLQRNQPWLFTGWFWYLGTLVPVIGIVQVGAQSMADRYTYIPLMGIYLAVAFAVADLVARRQALRPVAAALAVAVLVALGVRAHNQVATWKDSETLYRHALAVDPRNHVAHSLLGVVLDQRGQDDLALDHFRAAIECDPTDAIARFNLGHLLLELDRLSEARQHLEAATRMNPADANAWNSLGATIEKSGDLQSALWHYRRAVEVDSAHAAARANVQGVRALLAESP